MGGALGAAGLLGGAAQLVSIASAFYLGGRLIRRGVTRNAAPELLLGLHLALAIGVGSLLLTVVAISAYADVGASAASLSRVALAGNVVTVFGLMSALWFNYRVFHAGSGAGALFAGVGSLAMWGGLAHFIASGGLDNPGEFGAAYYPFCAAQVAADLWVAGEAIHFRAQMKRRLALGLVEPVVVERLGLWGYGALARIGLVTMAPIVNGLALSHEQRSEIAPALLVVSSLLIASTCVAYWLMLSPTQSYLRWVERRYAIARS